MLCGGIAGNVIISSFLESFKVYEMEEDVTRDLGEFSIANAIYAALVEAHASEISSRLAIHRR